MLYRLNVALLLQGDRVEAGTEVELTKEEVARLDPADIERVSEIDIPEPEVELSTIPLDELSYVQLQARAKELGLSASGSAADLRERISLHVPGETEDETSEEGQDGEDSNEDETSEEDQSQGG